MFSGNIIQPGEEGKREMEEEEEGLDQKGKVHTGKQRAGVQRTSKHAGSGM